MTVKRHLLFHVQMITILWILRETPNQVDNFVEFHFVLVTRYHLAFFKLE